MNEKEFVVSKIRYLASIFAGIIIGYEYKEESKTHIIKILPEKIYNTKEFKIKTSEIISEYIDEYNNSLSFISESSIIKLDKPVIHFGLGKVSGEKIYPQFILRKVNLCLTADIHTSKPCLNKNYDLAA